MSDRMRSFPIRLALDPTAFIAPGAVVVGEVRLAARASVWFNTVLRGDCAAIEVSEDSNLQDNVTVHVDEEQPVSIGSRVTVGHGAIIHGCVIEDECLVGMGAVILSGARVGKGSLVGAAALVRERQQIPPGSLVLGQPARVVGAVSEVHREAIRRGSEHYVLLSRAYLRRGFAGPHPGPAGAAGRTALDRGPMSFFEWNRLIEILTESPRWAAGLLAATALERWRVAPRTGAWSALEVLCHLRDAEHDVYLPRLGRMLAVTDPEVADVDMTGWDRARDYLGEQPGRALEAWRQDRDRLIGLLARLGPADWVRVGIHSVRGPFPLATMVRAWVEHDLSHRRQITLALGAL